jgi:DNA-binding transcriptional LysR family regulator
MSSTSPRAALSPDNLGLIEAVARLGSMAAAAREMGMVPSALTYRVRQVEDALDVLLFDRSSRRAQLTPAGKELLHAGQHLLSELDAVAQRVKRVATGWEPQLTLAVETIVARNTLYELCEAFYAEGAPTRLKLREETLSGTLESLLQGQADLAIGVADTVAQAGILFAPLGSVEFVFAVAPHHPLASATHKLSETERAQHRAVAVSDSTRRGRGVSHNLSPGQDLLTVPTMHHKLEAQLRGLGAGFLPLPLAQPYIQAGRLVVKAVQNPNPVVRMQVAWRVPSNAGDTGRALQWWLARLQNPSTRAALLDRHLLL